MDVRIGVVYTAKELSLEIEGTSDEVVELVKGQLGGNDPMLWLTDKRGRRLGVPIEKLAYVEIEGEEGQKPVGFSR